MTIKIEFPSDRRDIALAIGQALTNIGTERTRTTGAVPELASGYRTGGAEQDETPYRPAPDDIEYEGLEQSEEVTAGEYVESGEADSLKFYCLDYDLECAYVFESREELEAARARTPRITLTDLPHYMEAVAKWEAAALPTGKEENEPAGPFYCLHHESESGDIVDTAELADAAAGQGCDLVSKEVYESTMAKWEAAREEEHVAGCGAHTGAPLDDHGVAKDDEYCATAKVPFYSSGKNKGQWKKRQGVDQKAYDDWYASAKPAAAPSEEPQAPSNAAANTFGAQPDTTESHAPTDAGGLMKWVSEQQTAGKLTQQDVNDGFAALEIPFDGLMNADAATNCAKMYNYLAERI